VLDEKTPYVDPSRQGSAVLRIIWMASLPFILLSAFLIADEERWTFGTRDVVLLLLVAAAIAARAADTVWFAGTTADGEASTHAHVMRFSMRVILLAAVAWLVAQSVAI
jgi:hypothetical protein